MRPNIVFAFADDWGRYASAYRNQPGESSIHELIETPNFDRIAGEGTLFLNANVPAPSCTPCRSSILTGRYFWQTGLGAILQGARWDETIPTYPLILEEAGYHIGYTYKVWSPGLTTNAPYGGARTAYESAGSRYNAFSEEVTARPAGQSIEDAKQEILDETADNFQSFLDARPKNDDGTDEPFCYWWGPTNTHREWQQGSGKELWNIDPDDLKGRMPEFLPDVHEIREDFADYLGECQAVDAGLGVLLAKLEEIGELDNTIIAVSGDHGIPGFPRAKCNLYKLGTEVTMAVRWPEAISAGRTVDDFVNLMDIAPTFLEAAGVDLPKGMTGKSLMPLLRSEGSGQIEPERDFVVTGRERHNLKENPGPDEGLPYPTRAIRTKDFLYIHNFEPDRWPAGDPMGLDDPTKEPPPADELLHSYTVVYADLDKGPTRSWMIYNRADPEVAPLFELGFGKRPQEELYDLRSDPHYMTNLAQDPEHEDKRKELHDRLMAILVEQNDPRVVETPVRFEHPPYAGPVPEDWKIENAKGVESLGTSR
ncbi:sulfatase family protein [Candidatus Lucifugimonas marina]|uniref:sulfatase family protein n=1 Tax=Candidatus Lucifugimonas marina TaxID=3038979 RepID=UPI00319E7094